MAINLFGFRISKKEDDHDPIQVPSIVPPTNNDAAIDMASGAGAYGFSIDTEGSIKNEVDLINVYREMVTTPDVDSAVDDIVNEAIVDDNKSNVIDLDLNNVTDISSIIKNRLNDEFKEILSLLRFNSNAYDIFRRWYIDGRIYYHIMIDKKNPNQGIKELRYIDPRKIKKIRTSKKSDQVLKSGIAPKYEEYFAYSPSNFMTSFDAKKTNLQGVIKIALDSICMCHSGLISIDGKMIHSHLHKARKALNQLRMLEDSVVIYRLARAPERRVFYIDVGNLPKMKAEQYMREIMAKHKNKLVYDASTGEIKDDRKFMTMLEDYWIPRREGSRGTEISQLASGQNLGEMEDVNYFRRKLYKSLNVPITRMEAETTFNLGRSSEITRDEVKFSKFIDRLRNRFSTLFLDLLEIQLALKNIMTRDEFSKIKNSIDFDFRRDNHFAELKEQEIMNGRMSQLSQMDSYVGKYFSTKWVRYKVLRQTEEEMEELDRQMEEEFQQDLQKQQDSAQDQPSDQQDQPSDQQDQPSDQQDQMPDDTQSNNLKNIARPRPKSRLSVPRRFGNGPARGKQKNIVDDK